MWSTLPGQTESMGFLPSGACYVEGSGTESTAGQQNSDIT